MKWYSPDIKPEKGREKWIMYCWQDDKDPLNLTFHVGERYDCYSHVLCWTYLGMEDFLNGKIVQKSDLPQYTGKRLITL